MADIVWQHGRKVKGGFKCNYCGREKSGGGATRFKQHLAHRGSDVADCPSVPPDVKAYFIEQLERNKDKARERARQKLLRDAAARSSNVDAEQLGGEGYDEDEELQEALRHSRQEYEFMQQAGPRYERGGGSGSRARGSDVRGMFTRSRSHVPERVRDYHLGLSSAPRQQRIDTGPWTVKGRTKRELLGRAWAKACHAVGIPGRKVDDPYFRAAIVETQNQGKYIYFKLYIFIFIIVISILYVSVTAGVGIKIPSGRDIDGKYLDENVKEIHNEIQKWKAEWEHCGVTLMCDSWTGPMRNSVINFLVYSGGTMYFLKSIDASGEIQDHQFLLQVFPASCIEHRHNRRHTHVSLTLLCRRSKHRS